MKVSVYLLTYNHSSYIHQAIESVLCQKNVEFELVIGDDYSTDGTREICKNYERRYPKCVRLLPNSEKLGMMRNAIRTLEACKGEYIALLEGDDYWIDDYKLQEQVEFLEQNKNYSLVFHRAKVLKGDVNQISLPDYYPVYKPKERTTLTDILQENFMATSTVVFRNNLRGSVPAWFSRMPIGDWPLHILNAQYGDIAYLDRVMSVYRIHQGGVWTNQMKTLEGELKAALQILEMYAVLDKEICLSSYNKKIIKNKQVDILLRVAKLYSDLGRSDLSLRYLVSAWKKDMRRCVGKLKGTLSIIKSVAESILKI